MDKLADKHTRTTRKICSQCCPLGPGSGHQNQMMKLISFLSITASLAATLEPLPDCQTSPCLLELRAASVSDGATRYRTRGYNGSVPGPTIRTRAGATLRIRLVNALSARDNVNRGHNENRLPNLSLIHI